MSVRKGTKPHLELPGDFVSACFCLGLVVGLTSVFRDLCFSRAANKIFGQIVTTSRKACSPKMGFAKIWYAPYTRIQTDFRPLLKFPAFDEIFHYSIFLGHYIFDPI